MSGEREGLLQQALVAEAGRRHRQMASLMRELAEMNVSLNEEERQTLSVAYHKLLAEPIEAASKVNERIASYRETSSKVNDEVVKSLMSLWFLLRAEIRNVCAEVSSLLALHLLPAAVTVESEVFYKKWRADVLRCAAAHSDNPEKEQFNNQAEEAYEIALEASYELPPTSLTRLCLYLHFATFTADVLRDLAKAVEIAKNAVEDAAAEWPVTCGLSKHMSGLYKETVIVLHLLSTNAEYWTQRLSRVLSPETLAGSFDMQLEDYEVVDEEGPQRPPLVSGYMTIRETLQQTRRASHQRRASKQPKA